MLHHVIRKLFSWLLILRVACCTKSRGAPIRGGRAVLSFVARSLFFNYSLEAARLSPPPLSHCRVIRARRRCTSRSTPLSRRSALLFSLRASLGDFSDFPGLDGGVRPYRLGRVRELRFANFVFFACSRFCFACSTLRALPSLSDILRPARLEMRLEGVDGAL